MRFLLAMYYCLIVSLRLSLSLFRRVPVCFLSLVSCFFSASILFISIFSWVWFLSWFVQYLYSELCFVFAITVRVMNIYVSVDVDSLRALSPLE